MPLAHILQILLMTSKLQNRYICSYIYIAPGVPCGYHLLMVHGFVEELTANSDPEYQWIDKIRTPRASNEARQALFAKLAGKYTLHAHRTVNEIL